MKSFVVLCLLTISTFAVNIDSIEDLNLLSLDTTDAFDEVLTLLTELEQNSEGELQTLQAEWDVQGGALLDICNEQNRILAEKDAECQAVEDVRDGYVDEQTAAQDHIDWIDARFVDNDEKLDRFKTKRCEANLLFVQHLMEHKQSLEAVRVLREILADTTEDELLGEGTNAKILADFGIKKHSNEEVAVLKNVLNSLSGLFAVMPNKIQNSFLELNAQFEIDPEFNMLNELSENMQKQSYYAPKKFAVQGEDQTDEELDSALDAEEDVLEGERDTYGEGYEDYTADVTERSEYLEMIAEMKRLNEARRRKKLGLPSQEEEEKQQAQEAKDERQKNRKLAKTQGKYANMYGKLEGGNKDKNIKVSKVRAIKGGPPPPPPPGPPPPMNLAPPPKPKKKKSKKKKAKTSVKKRNFQPQLDIKKNKSQEEKQRHVSEHSQPQRQEKSPQLQQQKPQMFVQQQPQLNQMLAQKQAMMYQQQQGMQQQMPQQMQYGHTPQQQEEDLEEEDFGIEFPGEQNGKLRFNYATQNIKKSYIFIFERINKGKKHHLEELIFFDKSANIPEGLAFCKESRHNNSYKQHSIQTVSTYAPKKNKVKEAQTYLKLEDVQPDIPTPQQQPVYQQKQKPKKVQQPQKSQDKPKPQQPKSGNGNANSQMQRCQERFEEVAQLMQTYIQEQRFEECARLKGPYQMIKTLISENDPRNLVSIKALLDKILGPEKEQVNYKEQLPTVEEINSKVQVRMGQLTQDMKFEECIALRDSKTNLTQLIEHAQTLQDQQQVKGYLAKIQQKMSQMGI